MAPGSTGRGGRGGAVDIVPAADAPGLVGRRVRPSRRSWRHPFAKDWDRYVVETDELSRTPSFRQLRDLILDYAAPRAGDRALDVGTGTGLLALPLAERVASVCALDISTTMVECVQSRAHEAGLQNMKLLVGSATHLALEDRSIDLAVSNYCFHHLDSVEKHQALEELHRVLVPGGLLVFADMMFDVSITDRRSRAIIATKVRALLRKGPGGALRLAKNAARTLAGVGERPASPEWWVKALVDACFVEVSVELLEHESGIALARKPL